MVDCYEMGEEETFDKACQGVVEFSVGVWQGGASAVAWTSPSAICVACLKFQKQSASC